MATVSVIENNMETLKHIRRVRDLLYQVILELDKRGQEHDASKLGSPEQEGFAAHVEELGKTKFATKEYEKLLETLKPTIEHHYAKNRHHPEHFPGGIEDMTLLDLIEMLCDWKASTERVKNGNLRQSVAHNAKRFKMTPQLAKIFENTMKELFQD